MALIFALIFFALNFIPHIVLVPIVFEIGAHYCDMRPYSFDFV